MASAGVIITAISSMVGAYASMESGRQQRKVAEANAQIYEQQAKDRAGYVQVPE